MLTGKEYFYPYFRKSVLRLSEERLVVDIGTTCKFRKELAPFRKYFKKNYFALDYKSNAESPGDNVDIDSSIYCLPFKDNFIDAVLCLSVFEHLHDPFKAAFEIFRVLKPAGKAFITIPFISGEHAKKGDYGDFYRFTEQGIKYLFRGFSFVEAEPQGRGVYYRLSLFPGLLRIFQNRLGMRIVRSLDLKTTGRTTAAWMINLRK